MYQSPTPKKIQAKSDISEEQKRANLEGIFNARKAPGVVHAKAAVPVYESFKPKSAFEEKLKLDMERGYDPIEGKFFATEQEKREYYAPKGGLPDTIGMKEARTVMPQNEAQVQKEIHQKKTDAFDEAVRQTAHQLNIDMPDPSKGNNIGHLIRETEKRGGGMFVG